MDHNVCRLQAGPVRLCHLALLPAEYFQLTLRGPATTVTRTIHYTATTFISNFLMVVYHSSEIPWNIYHLNLNSTAPRHGGKLFMTDVIIILTWRALPESGGEGTILSLLQDCRTAVTEGEIWTTQWWLTTQSGLTPRSIVIASTPHVRILLLRFLIKIPPTQPRHK